MKITLIAGARPNFMKVAPIIKAIKAFNELKSEGVNELKNEGISYRLVHTGQHYDKNMSDTFFEELGIPDPDVNLGCGQVHTRRRRFRHTIALATPHGHRPASPSVPAGNWAYPCYPNSWRTCNDWQRT